MANSITYQRHNELEPLQMSNGLTSAFFSVASLAASVLAQTDRHREIAAWFASHDQDAFGLGIVGFDVSEIPWNASTFEKDRAFVLALIEGARARMGWDRLAYSPREDWLVDCLSSFERFVRAFDVQDAKPQTDAQGWPFGERPARFVLCPKHAVYLHSQGCILCNDQ